MGSRIILQQLGDLIIDYFTNYRKLISFDGSFDDITARKQVKREVSLIDYPVITGVPVKFLFKSHDIRQKLTKFKKKNINDERFEEIVKALERNILYKVKRINKEKNRKIRSKRTWNKFWWKTTGKGFTFTSAYLTQMHLNIHKNNVEWSSDSTFRSKRTAKNETPKRNWPRIRGEVPKTLKTCHPIPLRGEAERITKMAAKLLLITEQDEHDQMIKSIKPIKSNRPKSIKRYNRQLSENSFQSILTNDKMFTEMPGEISQQQVSSIRNDKSDFFKDNSVQFSSFKIKKDVRKDSLMSGSLPPMKRISGKSDRTNSLPKLNIEDKMSQSLKSGSGPDNNVGVIIMQSENEDSKSITESISKQETLKDIQQKSEESFLPKVNFKSQSEEKIDTLKEVDNSKNLENKNNLNNSHVKTQKSNSNENIMIEDGNKKCKSQKKKSHLVKQNFRIKTVTGERLGASTKAPIWLFIIGDQGRLSKSVHLKTSRLHCIPFGRGNTDEFNLKSAVELGFIQSIQIGHDSNEPGSDWFLEYVEITDLDMRYQYKFPCHRWLSVRTEDKQTRVSLLPHMPTVPNALIDLPNRDADNKASDNNSNREEYIQQKTNRKLQSAPNKSTLRIPMKDAEVQYSPRKSNNEPDFEITGGKNRIKIINKQTVGQEKDNEIENNRKKKDLVIPEDDNTWSDLMVEMSQESLTDMCSCFTTEFKQFRDSPGAPSVSTRTVTPVHQPETSIRVASEMTHSRSVAPSIVGTATTTITKYNVQTRNVSQACLSLTENMSSRLGNVGTQNTEENSSSTSQTL